MEGSIKKRLLAMLVVVVMLLSTVMIFSTTMAETYLEVETQGKIPGVTVWAACSATTVGAGASANGSVLNTSTANLYYDQTVSINVNGSLNWGAGPYWVWYPKYTGALGDTYNLTWGKWKPSSGPHPTIGGTDLTFENVHFNRSGLWLIDDNDVHDGSSFANMNSTIPAWFWVNSSSDLVITLSETSVDYGEKKNVVVNVKKGGEAVPCTVDVRAFSNNATVFSAGNAWTTSGEFSFRADTTNFSHAGTYNVYAYVDKDPQDIYYKEMPSSPYYSTAYGDGSVDNTIENEAGWYEYDCCGPWDTPEYNQSAIKTITVGASKPVITATNTSNVYWGYNVKLEVNVTDAYGVGLNNSSECRLRVKTRGGAYLDSTSYPADLLINFVAEQPGNYTVEFVRGSAHWNNLAATNGTWKLVYGENVDANGGEEWNNSLSFSVKSKAPAVRLDVTNDGSITGDTTDMKVDVPAYTSGNENNTVNISFAIYGGSVDGVKAFYGDDAGEDEKNITISGDALLYPAILSCVDHNWTAKVTPTKPGGEIKISVDWEGNGTDSATISIINGTTVLPSIDSFTVDENMSLTVTIKSKTGSLLEYSVVTLFWGDWQSGLGGTGAGEVINTTSGDGTAGNGANGEYTFTINTTEQRDIAPQNITIVANTPTVNYWGYAQVLMDRNHDLIVNCTPVVSYAGVNTEYDIHVTLASGGKPDEDSTLNVKIYNETGALVTGTDAWSSQGSADIEDEPIPLSGGTYYLYAYNNTHDSEGHNATIIVTPYSVESSPSVLAWLVDTATNMTFQVTPAGNGTLTLKNMSGAPNASASSDSSVTYDIEIINGVGTLDEVNATTLGNVTFAYTPDDGVLRPAEGLLRITTATAVPNPATVYIAEPTIIEVALTHPATGLPLQGVRVGLDHGKNLSTTLLIKLPADQFSDADGKVYFSVETGGSGNITIYMENQTDPDNPFVIKSAARKTMKIYTDPTVNEGDTFTVTAKSGGVVITDSTVTMEFAGTTLTTTDGTVEFTAPSVQDSVNYLIQATADGYTSDDATIKVLNVRKLVIVITSTKVSGGSAFDVTIADDAGNSVIGVTITIDQKTYTTGAQGTATITAPEKQGDYIITATFPGYTDADPYTITIEAGQIPGFELMTLIAAIGVAFILLRRRRN